MENRDIEIKKHSNKWKASFYVPQVYFPNFNGKVDSIVEKHQGVHIQFPSRKLGGDVVVYGPTEESVRSICNKIEEILVNCQSNMTPTHFLTFKIDLAKIKSNYDEFEEAVFAFGGCLWRVGHEMFVPSDNLHIVFAELNLQRNVDKTIAIDFLNDCLENIVRPIVRKHNVLYARIKGVETTETHFSKVTTVHGKIQSNALQEVADAINSYFISKGLARIREPQNPELHMKLIDARMGATPENANRTIDGREILSRFAGHYFGTQEIHSIQLVNINSSTGYYESVHEINF